MAEGERPGCRPIKKAGPSGILTMLTESLGFGGGLYPGSEEDCVTRVNVGEEDEMEVWGYELSLVRYVLTLALVVCTGGLMGLPLYWKRRWWLQLTKTPCSLHKATQVLVVDSYKGLHTTYFVKEVYSFKHQDKDILVPCSQGPGYKKVDELRFFNCKKNKYIWESEEEKFFKVEGLDRDISLSELQEYKKGLTDEEIATRAFLYGKNEIVVPLDSIAVLAVKEILSPFYIFQIFSISFWYYDEYSLYATAILLTSILSVTSALYQTRKNQANLRDTIVSSEVVTRIKKDGAKEDVISSDLVPGDLILVPDHGCQLLCDAVLLEGQAIMNESMLTGESVPVTKTSPEVESPSGVYDVKEHDKHTLKCGTQVIQTRKYKDQVVCAVVLRTGYSTTKGALVRSILYPPPVDFQFEKDSYKFIGILASIALMGMGYTMVRMAINEETFHDICMEVLDLITIVVPPALPAAMTIGIVLANQRLVPKNIFCISPRTINVAGTTDCVCFDKTGTITEDGMDLWGVVPVAKGMSLLREIDDSSKKSQDSPDWKDTVREISEMTPDSLIVLGMATCVDLNMIEGEVIGEPMDEKMFSSTGWSMEIEGEEQSQSDKLVGSFMKSGRLQNGSVFTAALQKLFQFSSELQRMSVIVRVIQETGDEDFSPPSTLVFCKGSPEKIEQLCCAESLPSNYREILNGYASNGFRVLAMAGKLIPVNLARAGKINKMSREEAEKDLQFLGLVVLENRLKPVSAGVIAELHGANIRPIMVTGDNILTAVSVARDCGLVPTAQRVIQVKVAKEEDGKPFVTFHSLEGGGDEGGNEKEVNIDIEHRKYHFAIDGANFEQICEDFHETVLPNLAIRGAVFARMKPDMKQRLVEILQDLGYCVIMCGDGANDCGALKAANAGISLSEAEASVASPFTSKTPDISCVPVLIKESRAALVTSFGIFKYMAAYSITQFVSVMILYDIFSNLSDFQFVFIDMFIITTLAALFGFNGAHPGPLAKYPPRSSLFGVLPVFSLLSQLFIAVVIQVTALLYTRSRTDWFVPFQWDNPCYLNTNASEHFNTTGIPKCDPDDDPVASYENFAIFSISQFQYIILAISFSKGAPYRENIFKNIPFLLDIIVLVGYCLFLVLAPETWPNALLQFELLPPPAADTTYRWMILVLILANFIISLFVEFVVSDRLVDRWTRQSDKPYNKIENELVNSQDWPTMSLHLDPVSEKAAPPNSVSKSVKDVFIREADIVRPTNQAFDSLFTTPETNHITAATSLNVGIKKKADHSTDCSPDVLLASPARSFATAAQSPASSTSDGVVNIFQSCDSKIDLESR